MKSSVRILSIAFFFLAGAALADPNEPSAASAPAASDTASAPAETSAPVKKPSGKASQVSKKKGGKRASEKETEGTEAADRFQADTVLKSKYRVNGQQLEVDPD